MRDVNPALDRCGSPPEVAVWALMSALADSGRATGSAWVRVVPCMDGARRAREKNSDLLAKRYGCSHVSGL